MAREAMVHRGKKSDDSGSKLDGKKASDNEEVTSPFKPGAKVATEMGDRTKKSLAFTSTQLVEVAVVARGDGINGADGVVGEK